MLQRYSRQTVFDGIGDKGQRKLLDSKVAIIGLGATGSVISNNLCRAGIGFIRLVDEDYVKLEDIQRQLLYDEIDAIKQSAKSAASYQRLSNINSEITIEPIFAYANETNIEELIGDVDLVLDGTDNIEARYLINEACVRLGKPWIYAGVSTHEGLTMNIFPGETACFNCLYPTGIAEQDFPKCTTIGVLNSITNVIASVSSTEAIKILIGSNKVRKNLFHIDLWNNSSDYVDIERNPDCPVCGKR